MTKTCRPTPSGLTRARTTGFTESTRSTSERVCQAISLASWRAE